MSGILVKFTMTLTVMDDESNDLVHCKACQIANEYALSNVRLRNINVHILQSLLLYNLNYQLETSKMQPLT